MKKCKYCKKVIIENFYEWLNENPDDKYIECCYCGKLEQVRFTE